MKTWEPEHIFKKADFSSSRKLGNKEPNKSEEHKATQNAELNIKQNTTQSAEQNTEEKSKNNLDQPLRDLLEKAALRSPENTLRFLRRWYWEKWPPSEAGSSSSISSVSPHDRLAVVFLLMNRETLGYFFRMMSPVERNNFSEIMSRQPDFKQNTVQRICQEFLEGLKIRH